MKSKNISNTGFTLIEIVSVMVILGIILSFVVPRAMRASVDTKYQLLRQGGTELASWANEWAQREIDTQPLAAQSTLSDYMNTLGNTGSPFYWVSQGTSASNWQGALANVAIRGGPGISAAPTTSVAAIMPVGKRIKNPFNGLSVFASANLPSGSRVIPGSLGAARATEGASPNTYNYYALVFHGTDSTSATDFHAGMGTTLSGLRAGIYIARLNNN